MNNARYSHDLIARLVANQVAMEGLCVIIQARHVVDTMAHDDTSASLGLLEEINKLAYALDDLDRIESAAHLCSRVPAETCPTIDGECPDGANNAQGAFDDAQLNLRERIAEISHWAPHIAPVDDPSEIVLLESGSQHGEVTDVSFRVGSQGYSIDFTKRTIMRDERYDA